LALTGLQRNGLTARWTSAASSSPQRARATAIVTRRGWAGAYHGKIATVLLASRLGCPPSRSWVEGVLPITHVQDPRTRAGDRPERWHRWTSTEVCQRAATRRSSKQYYGAGRLWPRIPSARRSASGATLCTSPGACWLFIALQFCAPSPAGTPAGGKDCLTRGTVHERDVLHLFTYAPGRPDLIREGGPSTWLAWPTSTIRPSSSPRR
jgi:hypothetical protein